MFLEGNKALILLIGLISVILLVGSIFVFVTRPEATIQFESDGEEIIMSHKGGDDLLWEELMISVTEGRDSNPVFINPTSGNGYALGEDNQPLNAQDSDDKIQRGEAMKIYRTSNKGSELVTSKYYHIVVKYKSTTDTVITDKNVWLSPEYG